MDEVNITDEEFGPLLKYIKDNDITNINYTNGFIYLRNKNCKQSKIKDLEVTDNWVKSFYNMIVKKSECKNNESVFIRVDNLQIGCLPEWMTKEECGCLIAIRKL